MDGHRLGASLRFSNTLRCHCPWQQSTEDAKITTNLTGTSMLVPSTLAGWAPPMKAPQGFPGADLGLLPLALLAVKETSPVPSTHTGVVVTGVLVCPGSGSHPGLILVPKTSRY